MHEIHLKEDEEETQPKTRVTFKTTSEEYYSSEDECSEEDEDFMAMIARGLKKIFKSKTFDPKKFYKKRFSLKKKDKSSKGNKLSNNKNESNLGPCFSCDLPGHVMKDWPIIQKRVEKHKQKAKKEFKKDIIATWSDSDSSDSDNEVEQVTNLCFMANEENVQEDKTKYESSDKVDYSNFLEYSKNELAHSLINCIRCEQKYLFKIKSLKKATWELESEMREKYPALFPSGKQISRTKFF